MLGKMERRSILYVIYVIYCASFTSFILSDDPNICKDVETGRNECCADYKNISGICQACIGFFGKNCKFPCQYGYYGHGCNEKCHCSKVQICDKAKGCLDVTNTSKDFSHNPDRSDNLETIVITAGSLLILIIFGFLAACHLQKRLRKLSGKGGKTLKSAPSGNTSNDKQEQAECIYVDVRESRMFENAVMNPTICNTVQRQHLGNIAHIKSSRSLPRQYKIKGRQQLTNTSSENFDDYGSPETYNHLQYKKMCTLPAISYIPMNNYCSMKANPPNSQLSCINVKTEMYSKGVGSKYSTPEDSATLPRLGYPKTRHFRPYSSVRFNRNAKPEMKTMH